MHDRNFNLSQLHTLYLKINKNTAYHVGLLPPVSGPVEWYVDGGVVALGQLLHDYSLVRSKKRDNFGNFV